jgi:LPXTG-motif cell wall-anchored protein
MLLGTNNQYLVVYAGLLALLFASLLFAYKVKKYKREVFNGK